MCCMILVRAAWFLPAPQVVVSLGVTFYTQKSICGDQAACNWSIIPGDIANDRCEHVKSSFDLDMVD